MAWVELTQSQSCSVDQYGNAYATRVYRVWDSETDGTTFDKTQILQDPQTILNEQGRPLPPVGHRWQEVSAVGSTSDNPNRYLVLYKYVVEESPGLSYIVRALYSNDPALVTNIVEYQQTALTEKMGLPFARYKPLYLLAGGGNILRVYHDEDRQDVLCPYNILTVSVQIPTSETEKFITQTNFQAGKIHRFANRLWGFQSADLRRVTPFFSRATYVWKYDPGTELVYWPNIPVVNCGSTAVFTDVCGTATHIFPQPKKWDESGTNPLMLWINSVYRDSDGQPKRWVRPPFHELVYVNPPCPQECPKFQIRTEWQPSSLLAGSTTDSTLGLGWKLLPGHETFPSELFGGQG